MLLLVVTAMRSEIDSARTSAILRRAERGLGVAIREGQARGEVIARGKNLRSETLAQYEEVGDTNFLPRPVIDFASKHELSGNRSGQPGIYALTDDVSDAEFADALADAKAEGNLSRANVARKCRCLDCRRPLRAPSSVAAQRGPVCRQRAEVVA